MKKTAGVIFIIIAIILGLGFLMQLPSTISTFFNAPLSYALGNATASIVFGVAAFFLLRWGIKWVK